MNAQESNYKVQKCISMTFKVNGLLFTSGQYIEIVHLFSIGMDKYKNTKSANNAS